MHTSIFRPSTIVPFSFSRAASASALFANVTKPNPCMQHRQKKHAQIVLMKLTKNKKLYKDKNKMKRKRKKKRNCNHWLKLNQEMH